MRKIGNSLRHSATSVSAATLRISSMYNVFISD
jgi:hypothetical protein